MKLKRLLAGLVALVMVMGAVPTFAAEGETEGYVIGTYRVKDENGVDLREDHSSSSDSQITIPYNTILEISEIYKNGQVSNSHYWGKTTYTVVSDSEDKTEYLGWVRLDKCILRITEYFYVDGELYTTVEHDEGAEWAMPEYTPDEGYTFSGWELGEDGNYYGTTEQNPIHTLTILYLNRSNENIHDPITSQLAEGVSYDIPSPVIDGYLADRETVSGQMGKADKTEIVFYDLVFTITWKNYDGTVLAENLVAYGATPVYEGETPEKPADAQYTYTFSGWTPEIVPVTGNATYTASFESHTRSYTITWVIGDASEQEIYEYGQTPEYKNGTPQMEPTAEYYYTFVGWTPEIVPVTGNATYTAVFESHLRSYTLTINYVYADGSEAVPTYTGSIEYGTIYSVTSPTVTGYTPSQAIVSGTMPASDVTLTVTYAINSYTLTINYVYADGSVAAPQYTATLEYGASYRVISPAIPGYTADRPLVAGVMDDSNIDITVTYTADVILGDVNGDGFINANDALLILRYSLGLIDLNNQLEAAGDVNGDGFINANDALYVLRMSLGLM